MKSISNGSIAQIQDAQYALAIGIRRVRPPPEEMKVAVCFTLRPKLLDGSPETPVVHCYPCLSVHVVQRHGGHYFRAIKKVVF